MYKQRQGFTTLGCTRGLYVVKEKVWDFQNDGRVIVLSYGRYKFGRLCKTR